MKSHLIACLLLIISFQLYAQNTINIPSFGTLSYTKTASGYNINIEELGTFDFVGTLKPLNLETEITPEQLKNFPNYEIVEALELEDLHLKIKKDSLLLEGKADTQKKLKTLCQALKIEAPFIDFTALVSPSQMQLQAGLDFSDAPITVNVSEEIGTQFTIKQISILSTMGGIKNNLLTVLANMKIKPTQHDPNLNSKMVLSYNLLTTELTGAGAINDSWTDPLGMSKFVNIEKDAVSLDSTTVTLGWVPSSPVPTTMGFAVGKARLFSLEAKALVGIAPLKKEIALEAHQKEMTTQDFLVMLEKGFKLKVPSNTFPSDMKIYDIDMLFSPSGAKIGDQTIPKGFLYKAGITLSDVLSGSMNFYALKDSLALGIDMDTQRFSSYLEDKINQGKETELDKALKQTLSSLAIKKIQVRLEANKKLELTGATFCELVIFGKEMTFSFDQTLEPDKMVNNIIKNIAKTALENFSKSKKK